MIENSESRRKAWSMLRVTCKPPCRGTGKVLNTGEEKLTCRLKELHLPNNKLGYEGVKRLCEELAQPWTRGGNRPGNKSLQILGLKNNGIEPHCGDCVICRESPLFPKGHVSAIPFHHIQSCSG